jgi:hypothetical protein
MSTWIVGPIAPNKNGWLSCKNLDAMIRVTILQFSMYVVKVITSTKTKFIPPLEMGRETCQWTKGTFEHSKYIGLQQFPKYTNENRIKGG